MADTDDDAKVEPQDEAEIVAEAKKRFQIAEEAWERNRRNALENLRFARQEEQWPENIRRERELEGRPCLTLNQLHTFIFQVVNDARQNQPAIEVHPVGSGADQETAEIINGLIRHIERSSDAEVAYDTGMDFAVSASFGFWRVNMRYATDDNFDKDLVIERVSNTLAVYPDPYSTAADSSDWNECWILDAIPKAAWEKRWPDKACVAFDGEAPQRETSDEELIQYAEQWTREEVARTIVLLGPIDQTGDPAQVAQANALAGEQMIVGADVYQANKALFDTLGVVVKAQRDVISHKVTQRLLSGAEILEEVEWAGSFIPIVPVYGEDLTVDGQRMLRNLTQGAHDAQRMFNYWNTTATELVALAPKTPWLGKVGQFATDAAKWATANTQTHAYIEYDDVPGAEGAPQRVPFAGIPSGVVQQATSAQQMIMSIVGIYKSSIGAPSNETSGVAINARDKQADTGSFHFMDNLNRAIRHTGRILIDLIPKVYSTPRVLRIIKPDGQPDTATVNQPVPAMGPNGQPMMQQDPMTGELRAVERIYDLTVGKYDLVVKSGPSYATQREELNTMLTEIIRAYPAAAPALVDIIVRNMDIPDADEITQRLVAAGPQNPQLQQAQQTIQQGQQLILSMKAEIAKLKGEATGYDRENDIKAYEAETDRLKVIVGNQGAASDPQAMAQVVMASLLTILRSPDILDGMQGGADPQAMAALLAQRMAPQSSEPQTQMPPPMGQAA